jgi:E3 SUMO-protein ligase RanBP2
MTIPSVVNNANVSAVTSSTLEDIYEEDDETDDDEQKQENLAPSFIQLANQQTGFSFAKSVSEVQNDDDNYEPDIQVKPLVSLPELETIVTGEENESVLFENHAKLFHNVNGEWKERGKGIMKILRNDETKRCRCVMKREQVLKLCCNHYIVEGMKLKPFQNSKVAWLWKALKDCSSDNVMDEVLVAVRFKTADIALNFKDVFEKCCHRGGLEEDKRETSDTENNKRMEIKDIKADDDDQMKEDDEIKAADDDWRKEDDIIAADDDRMKEDDEIKAADDDRMKEDDEIKAADDDRMKEDDEIKAADEMESKNVMI